MRLMRDFKWRSAAAVMVVSLLAIAGFVIASPDLGYFVSLFGVVPLAGIGLVTLLFGGSLRTRQVRFALLCTFGLLSWLTLKHAEEIRSEARWMAGSTRWKREVLEHQPDPKYGMKWTIWDGWGIFAQDTDVYLVFSPDDRLRNYSPSNMSGLPCPVWHVQRLEKQWYSVTFYTNQGWGAKGCQ